jgi:hypothetical protein
LEETVVIGLRQERALLLVVARSWDHHSRNDLRLHDIPPRRRATDKFYCSTSACVILLAYSPMGESEQLLRTVTDQLVVD